MTSRHHIPPLAYFLIVALALMWGLSWSLMKLALVEMEPLRFRAFSVGVGGVGLILVSLASGASIRLTRDTFWKIAGVALFSSVLWSVCMAYGLRLMASSRAVIIAYMFPIWSVPLGVWLLKEPLTGRRILGLLLGLAGLAVLMGDEIHAVGRSPLGALLMFATATCWAIGTILAKKWSVQMPASSFAGWLQICAFVPLALLSLPLEQGPWHPLTLGTGPMIGALYSGLVASLLCHWAWFKLVAITPAAVSSLSILSVPIVGVFSGLAVLGEVPRATDYVALLLVVASLATVLLPARQASTPQE